MSLLIDKYPPSEPCSCNVCVNYCVRPGWWTVQEADAAIRVGYANRMMLEMSPELTFGVLSPAFRGCEGNLAMHIFKDRGCNFLKNERCELFGSGLVPLECRFCHHDRQGQGQICHLDIESDWNTPAGQSLIVQWGKMTGLWNRISSMRGRK